MLSLPVCERAGNETGDNGLEARQAWHVRRHRVHQRRRSVHCQQERWVRAGCTLHRTGMASALAAFRFFVGANRSLGAGLGRPLRRRARARASGSSARCTGSAQGNRSVGSVRAGSHSHADARFCTEKNDPRLKGIRQFQTQPQKRGQTADNWGQKKYTHKPLFDVRAPLVFSLYCQSAQRHTRPRSAGPLLHC